MPEPKPKGLRDALTIEELRDLFRYAWDVWEQGARESIHTDARNERLKQIIDKCAEAYEADLQRRNLRRGIYG